MRLLVTLTLSLLAAAMTAILGLHSLATGMPDPLLLSLAVMSVSAAVAWPLATMENHQLCASCHQSALRLGDFGFCLRCGATNAVRR